MADTAESKKVTLSGGKTISVRKPFLRDIRAHFNEPNHEERQVMITATLCQMTVDELDNLPYSDFLLLQKGAESFLSSGGETALNPSQSSENS